MRPYRGLTKEGKWVYGWYVDSASFDAHCIVVGYEDTLEDGSKHRYEDYIEVIPSTVGQQIGKQDKNGVEAHQHDLVKWWPDGYYWEDDTADDLAEEETGVIVWHQPAGRWAIEVRGHLYWPQGIDFFDFEVIGNIHQPHKEADND